MSRSQVLVIGGGISGCAAALSARKAGIDKVTLLERSDRLTGNAMAGGIMANNGRFTAEEEIKLMGGGGDLFQDFRACVLHENVEFPGHRHCYLHDIHRIERLIHEHLERAGVEIRLQHRAIDVVRKGDRLVGLEVEVMEHRPDFRLHSFEADVFVDATGSAGGMEVCYRYGYGCSCCVLKCPTFGGRVAIGARAGVGTYCSSAGGQEGVISGSFDLQKETLPPEYVQELVRTGVVLVPLPQEALKLARKACSQYRLDAFKSNFVILHNGEAKVMASACEGLRQLPLLRNATMAQPLSGPELNSVRYIQVHFKRDDLRAAEVSNLFFAGESAGLHNGLTEAVCTGALAGYNAARAALGHDPMVLPLSTVTGHFIHWVNQRVQEASGRNERYTYSGGTYFEVMKELGLYTTDLRLIRQRVEAAGLADLFNRRWVPAEMVTP